tara:strand:- start:8 stop:334 length:327 start_codon:yes stop_codon:yes gene_type:complete
MEMMITLLWFMAGAISCLIVKNLLHFNEQRKIFINIVSAYIPLIWDMKNQIAVSITIKEQFLIDAGMSQQDIEASLKDDRELLENWEMLATTILIGSVPKKFHKYLKS